MSEKQPKTNKYQDNVLNGLESFLVVTVFLIAYNLLDLRWAIGITSLASLWFVYSRYRRGKIIGIFLPLITLFIIARGLVGILTDSEDVYFGIGIASGVGFGIALAASALIRKNLLALAVPYFFDFPEMVKAHRIYMEVLNRLAYILGVYYVAKAGFDLWIYTNNSVNNYLIIKTLVGWPLGLIVFWSCVGYAARKFSKIPRWEGFIVMMERQTVIYKEAIYIRFQQTFRRKGSD